MPRDTPGCACRLRAPAAAVLALFAAQPAWSQNAGPAPAGAAVVAAAEPQRIEIIGVTPLGGDVTPVSKTPANVQILKARDIREQGATNVADLLNDNIGPVSVSNGTGSPYQNDVNYRGFQASSVLGAPVGISVYFDGVRMNEPFGSLVNWDVIPMNAVSRVALMPGSNPLFGLNTLGGSIVLDTKNGRDDGQPAAEIKLGSFNRRDLSFEGGGIANAATDFFVAGSFNREDGFRLHSGSRVQQLFGKLRWRGDGSEIRLSAALADTHLSGTQSLPQDMMADRRSAYTWPDTTANTVGLLSLNGSHWLSSRNKLVGNVHYRDGRSKVSNSNAALDDGCFADDGTLALSGSDYKCGSKAPSGTAVNAVTGASALALGYARWTGSINTSVLASTIGQRTGGVSAQWLNLDRAFGLDNNFTLGGSADSSRVKYSQASQLARLVDHQTVVTGNRAYGFTADGLPPSPANLPVFSGSNVQSTVGLSSTTRNLSLYFTDKLEASDRLSLSVSGSYNVTHIEQSGINSQFLNDDGGYSWTDPVSGLSYYNPSYVTAYRYSNSGTGAATAQNGVPAGAIAGPESNSLDGAHRYRRFNPALGFVYKADESLGLFGSYSEAMRAPTSIELSCADPNNPCALPTGFNGDPDLKPVIARTVELGARGEFGSGVAWNAAVYDTRLKDDIQFIATSSTFGYFSNVGDTGRRGIEAGLQATFGPVHLAANVAHVKATFRSPFTTAAGEDVPAGSAIPGIPSNTLKLRAAWEPTSRWLIGTNVVAASRQYAHGNENNGDAAGVVPGYALAHLDLHFRPTHRLELSARVTNLFDRKYSTYGLSGVTSIYTLATQTFFTPAPPRLFWLALNYKLGS